MVIDPVLEKGWKWKGRKSLAIEKINTEDGQQMKAQTH